MKTGHPFQFMKMNQHLKANIFLLKLGMISRSMISTPMLTRV